MASTLLLECGQIAILAGMSLTDLPAIEKETPSDLVKRILAGERAAEEELVRRYHRGISIIIRRIAKDSFTTEDLCQETFRLVLEKVRRGDLREAEKLSGFVCSVARNLAIHHVRRPDPLEGVEEIASFCDPSPNQLSVLLEKERSTIVRRILKELKSERDRQILFRFYISEEDKEIICADLGLSSQHFNRVLYRARERFRELCQQVKR